MTNTNPIPSQGKEFVHRFCAPISLKSSEALDEVTLHFRVSRNTVLEQLVWKYADSVKPLPGRQRERVPICWTISVPCFSKLEAVKKRVNGLARATAVNYLIQNHLEEWTATQKPRAALLRKSANGKKRVLTVTVPAAAAEKLKKVCEAQNLNKSQACLRALKWAMPCRSKTLRTLTLSFTEAEINRLNERAVELGYRSRSAFVTQALLAAPLH